eukprot:NODE_716_length_4828_cov_0.189258.p4 type:complete len:126 gc:universal NODE_716_length_4828_cov_0.189258:2655-2278(-)
MKQQNLKSSKYFCEYCRIYVQNNQLQKLKHESSELHQLKRQKRIDESLGKKWDLPLKRESRAIKMVTEQKDRDINPLTGIGEWKSCTLKPVPIHVAIDLDKLKNPEKGVTVIPNVKFKKRIRKQR